MKKFIFIATAVLALAAFSCNSRENLPPVIPEDNVVTFEREFALPGMTRSDDGNVFGVISATFDLEAELVLSYTVDPDILAHLGMTATEFDQLLRDDLGDGYSNLAPQLGPSGGQATDVSDGGDSLTECREYCMDKYTDENGNKIPGRGRCLTGCWFDRIFTLIENCADAIASIFTA